MNAAAMIGKKLGQYFLINQTAIKKIIAALDLKFEDAIVEIGPGRGALTVPLAEKCKTIGCKIIAIEKDPLLALSVKRLGYRENLEIINDDILKILPEITKRYPLNAKRLKLVGNIPYYITGKLLRILSELENKPQLTVLTIQREVAERVTAKPPKTNLLAAAVQFWAEPKIVACLKPSDFSPPPKVKSAIIKLETRKQKIETRIAENYYKLIKIIFKQPRKTLLNNLAGGLPVDKSKIEEFLSQNGLPPDIRPQDLDLEKLSTLALILSDIGLL